MVHRCRTESVVEVAEIRRLEHEHPIAYVVAHGSEDGPAVVDARRHSSP